MEPTGRLTFVRWGILTAASALSVAAFAELAQVRVVGSVEADVFGMGTAVYVDRTYALVEPPESLAGKPYLRTPIDGFSFVVETPGEVICLTPPAGGSSPCSQDAVLEGSGFTLMRDPGEFQLFGTEKHNRVRPWRKNVSRGERFSFGKFVCLIADVFHPTLREPINIDLGRQLLLDDNLAATNSMKRTWHKPTVDPRSPLLRPETELEKSNNTKDPLWNALSAPFSGGVWYDGRERLYKCWYLAGWADGIAYATSADGLHWTRPDLDGKGNNLTIRTTGLCDSNAVLMDPDPRAEYRWKAFFFDLGKGLSPDRPMLGASVSQSRDGIVWTERVLATKTGDCSTAFFNPFIGKWVYSIRSGMYESGRFLGRWRDYAEGEDFVRDAQSMKPQHWRLRGVAGGREFNGQELYNFDAVAYESVMIGLALVFNSPQNGYWDKRGLPKIADLRFGFNSIPTERDTWKFPAQDEYDFFLEGTRRYGDWNMGYLRSNAAICIVHGDELWFYFSAFAGQPDKRKDFVHVNRKSGTYANGTMGLARLRRDGFCSLSDGKLTTRRLVFSQGDRLWVNADVRQGELSVSVDGRHVKTLSGVDATRIPICPLTPDRPFTMTFEAHGGARFYSFWTSDAKGRSGGYLAGGSPESTSLRDL